MSLLIMVVMVPKEPVQTSRTRLNVLFFWGANQKFLNKWAGVI